MKFFALVLSFVLTVAAAAQTTTQVSAGSETPAGSGVFLAALRTQNHMKYSDSTHFNEAVDGIEAFLAEKHVVTKSDPVRGKFRIEATMSKESVLRVAQDVGAAYALYLAVDRPKTAWMALSMQCFDMQGNMLWEYRAVANNMITSSGHVKKAVQKLSDNLAPKVGSACLPVADAQKAQPVPTGR